MSSWNAVPLTLAAGLALFAAPALALDRPAHPEGGSLVERVADLDRPTYRLERHHHAGAYAHWRYRAAYTRWLHNEYVVAGYPVNQYRSPTYYWVRSCCIRRRH
jgi:hypothetical protein